MRSRRPLLNPPHAASLTCANRRLPAFRRLGTRGSAAARSPWAPWARRQPRWPLSQSPPRLCATLSELHFAAASAALRLWPLFGTPAALIPPFLPHVSPPITLFAPLTRAAAALHAREQSGVSRACLGSVRLLYYSPPRAARARRVSRGEDLESLSVACAYHSILIEFLHREARWSTGG